jgi:hypothetical protein
MVVLADRNFLSHALARDVLATGAHILWRASASFTLRPIEVLADGSYLAILHPARKVDGPPITVRVIEYTVHTTTPDGTEEPSEVFALVTDLLDIDAYPALDLACAYPMRWGVETVIGHHKTDMGPGKPVLRSHDPEGVAQEMWALFAVYQAIHTLIGAAAEATGIPPDKISFPHALAAVTDTVTADFPLTALTSLSPPSSSRSSTRASWSATGPTGPVPGPPRKPATSPPAKTGPASSTSPDASRSTAYAPDPRAKRKAIGAIPVHRQVAGRTAVDLDRGPQHVRVGRLTHSHHCGLTPHDPSENHQRKKRCPRKSEAQAFTIVDLTEG